MSRFFFGKKILKSLQELILIFIKLVNTPAKPLSQPATAAINMCIKQKTFPNNAKVAPVASLDKGK